MAGTSEIDMLEQKITSYIKQIGDLNNNIISLESEKDKLTKNLSAEKGKLKKEKEMSKELKSEVADLQEVISKLNKKES